jgi:DNA-binding transcriptional regulator GbsR (MarR family)
VPKKKKNPPVKTWRPTVEDARLMDEMSEKLGVSDPDVVRMGLRKLAETILATPAVDK